jgi:sigma-B regulation protein RsbU (phosphoserine phosphatase)
MPGALFLVQIAASAAVQVAHTLTRSELRWEFLNMGVAVILLMVGVFSLVVYFFRRKSRERTLIFFGSFVILYAVRLFGDQTIARTLFAWHRSFWAYLNFVITATIVLPFALFLYQLVGENLRRFFRWVIAVQAAFGIVEIVGAAFGIDLDKLHAMNDFVVLGTVVVSIALIVLIRRSGPSASAAREIQIFIIGFSIWMVFIVHANLRGLHLVPGENSEFIGVLAFVGCLAYLTALRIFATEERLLAIHKELDIARQIQSSTLPREIPCLPHLQIAARYVPMSAVAGDFYDFLVLDDKRLGVLVADVTGHGVPAALIASMLKVAFAAQAEHAGDPARLLVGLNRALCGKFEDHFVTAAYVFVDMERNVLCYAGAGHPPLMLTSRSSGAVRQIEENGLMLGLFPEAEYSSTEIPLDSGDRCLIYTDGVFEAMNATQEEYGKQRMEQFLRAHSDLSAVAFTKALIDEVSHWADHANGRSQDDDITVLAIDFRPAVAALSS